MAGSGYYADPMSPIASTPMKRQRIKKPQNTKSVKAKHPPSSRKTPGSSCVEQSNGDQEYFSPRKLINEYDAEEDNVPAVTTGMKENRDAANSRASNSTSSKKKRKNITTSDTISSSRGRSRRHQQVHEHENHNNEDSDSDSDAISLFSPALKVPRSARSSRSPSRTRSTSRERLFGSSSSGPNSSSKDQDDQNSFLHECSEELSPDESYLSSSTASDNESTNSSEIIEFNPFLFMKALPKYDDIVRDTRPIVLPAKTPHAPKICLVLDLDETLVHCSVEKLDNPSLEFPVTFNGTEYVVYVKKRPHMDLFLKRVSKLFEVVVFTASQRVYAEKLLNLLDPQRELIKYRLYREDCLFVEGNLLKDLNVLGRHLSKVLLVDNSPHAFGYQVNNGIPIESWFHDDDDQELLNLLPFLESLADVDDVRPHIARQFQVQQLIDHAEFASVF